jgi:hypothetical protein
MTPLSQAKTIDYFNKRHPLIRLQGRVSVRLRQRMLETLPLKPEMSVLEVGATPDTELADSNFFSRQARALGCKVWVTSPEDCSAMAAENDLQWVPFDEIQRGTFTFDAVISSAVMEHAGASREHKLAHLRLLDALSCRLILVTTPNRSHWLEFHTKLPLLHWLPKPLHRSLLKQMGLKTWAESSHLNLLTFREFQDLLASVFDEGIVEIRKFWFLGAISNLIALIDKSKRT